MAARGPGRLVKEEALRACFPQNGGYYHLSQVIGVFESEVLEAPGSRARKCVVGTKGFYDL